MQFYLPLMRTDHELLGYLYQTGNVKRLESLIDALPDTMTRLEDKVKLEDAQRVYAGLVIPHTLALLPKSDFEKPGLKLYDDRMFQENTNHFLKKMLKHESLKYGATWGLAFGSVGLAGGVLTYNMNHYAPLILGLAGGLVGFLGGSLLSIPLTLVSHKMDNMTNAGMAERERNIIYVHAGQNLQKKVHVLAHEIAHRIVNQKDAVKGQLLVSEGLSQAVAYEVSRCSSHEMPMDTVFEMERRDLIAAHSEVVGKLKVPGKDYSEKEAIFRFLTRIENKSRRPYTVGYAAVRLLQLEHGNQVLAELAGI